MEEIRITLFGRLRIEHGTNALRGFQPRKVRELFCYLLLHPDQPHAREKIASAIYGEHCTTLLSRKYLRNALWRLQASLDRHARLTESKPLVAERDWIELRSDPLIRTDAWIVREAYELCEGAKEPEMTQSDLDAIDVASALYTAPLLEGWDQEWCVPEREEFARMALVLLEKRMAVCELRSDFERGISIGHHILREDGAHEPTHRRLMRLYYLVGDRTRALRQYEVCAFAMKNEFNAVPARETIDLHDLIASDPRDGKRLARQVSTSARDPFRGRQQAGVS